MNITLFGATGVIGSLIMNIALKNGDTIHAYARNPDKIKLQHNNLHIIKGELTNALAMEAAIEKPMWLSAQLGPL